MTVARTDHDASTTLGCCENCGTVLIGAHCHVCGQRAHSPLRHFGHAVEEVFESLWHLDGRIFRTLRDLIVPGRVAAGYLAGHRVRYVAPLRLFVILSLITFFVGTSTLHLGPDTTHSGDGLGDPVIRFSSAQPGDDNHARAETIEQVLAIRDQSMRELDEGRSDPASGWVLEPLSGAVIQDIDLAARKRLQALGYGKETIDAAFAKADAARNAKKPIDASRTAAEAAPADGMIARWLDRRGARFKQNAALIEQNPDEFVRLFFSAMPGALFLLVPFFALCLKLFYIRSGRGYLEHLVVALYSHAFMLVALLASFLLLAMRSIPGLPAWGNAMSAATAVFTLFLIVPVYLLWMQKRVYAQGWVKTLMKYATLGFFYSVLLGFGIVYAILAGLSS